MQANRASFTAMISAFGRAYHATNDTPVIFDDSLASELFTPEERDSLAMNLAESLKFFAPEAAKDCPDQASALARVMRIQSAPTTLGRARYCEDLLEQAVGQGVRQYVILGAGLDTFAWRRQDLMQRLTVFEVDHPDTQADKRQRVARAGWVQPQNLQFVPIDFTAQTVADVLTGTPYDPQTPSFFSWLGVTYYLSPEAVSATLRGIAGIAAPGSELVVDYNGAEQEDEQARRTKEVVKMLGEPMQATFEPEAIEAILVEAGWRLAENLGPADIEARYFAERTDGYHAARQVHFVRAIRD